jgi:hypothetical protein
MGRMEQFGSGKGEQLKAHMSLAEDALNLSVGCDLKHGVMVLVQNDGRGGVSPIIFPTPEDMKAIGNILVEQAGILERGEIEGLEVPKCE